MTDRPPCPWTFPRPCGNGHALISIDDVYWSGSGSPSCKVCTVARVRRQRGTGATGQPSLRVLIWTLLPPTGPGLTREEICERVASGGREMMGQTLDLIMTGLRATSALRSDAGVPRRYWRGDASAEDVAGSQDRGRPWSAEEIERLRALVAEKPPLFMSTIARRMGRSRESISHKIGMLGLRGSVPATPAMEHGRVLTARGGAGGEPLRAGHPTSWSVVAAHTPSIPQRWPG